MKIAILGYGKMGKAIAALAKPDHEVLLKIGQHNRLELTSDHLSSCDVAIEFSSPDAAFDNIKSCLEAGIPVVSGTTGWLDRMNEVEALTAQRNGAFLYASNFSLGVNLFFAINKYAASIMGKFSSYEVSMEEQHHIHKLDAPSGTALSLAQDVLAEQPSLQGWSLTPDDKDKMHINAVREGEIPGTHSITYSSSEDQLMLSHTAHTRDSFARGALLAAEWLIGKTGVYGMQDLLEL